MKINNDNEELFIIENENKKNFNDEILDNKYENYFLYPHLDDPTFNIKIASKTEFNENKYDGKIYDVVERTKKIANTPKQLSPHQSFVKTFMSMQTPFNSLLLYHGTGSGKTCSAIGVCEEMRDYLKLFDIRRKIIIIANPNVQNNFRNQLFNTNNLQFTNGYWKMNDYCIGDKLINEVNPTSMKGLTKKKIITLVNSLIDKWYIFIGYKQFSNIILRTIQSHKIGSYQANILLENKFQNSLIVIDEAHNIRINNENVNKDISKHLFYLVSVVSNIRLLLLTATPMYNNHKEIILLLNLMNVNDRRSIVSADDIFDKKGDLKVDEMGVEVGKQLLLQKANGYISYVRGEDPYIFPYRIYPNLYAIDKTFKGEFYIYPDFALNGMKIKEENKIKKLDLFILEMQPEQLLNYVYALNQLIINNTTNTTQMETGDNQEVMKDISSKNSNSSLSSVLGLKYNKLQALIQILIITYPNKTISPFVKDDVILNESPPFRLDSDAVSKSESESELDISQSAQIEDENIEDIINVDEEFEQSSQSENIEKGNTDENKVSSVSDVSDVSDDLNISLNELFGLNGLKNVVSFTDTITPPVKGLYEYKKGYEHFFHPDNIGKYSCKIKQICDSIVIYNNETNEKQMAKGIILIYSSFIDSGLIPTALCLEEMGFKKYGENSLFKTPPQPQVDRSTTTYAMITGDIRLSPDNNEIMKIVTSKENIYGEKIKVILISQAGAEGLDFKGVRQVHILDPWYNMSRIEQIIGRAVRNYSHFHLPFEERNVMIFLYSIIMQQSDVSDSSDKSYKISKKLQNTESADLHIYRIAEQKAIKIGKISRILKEISVDCFINSEQNELTEELFSKSKQDISQHLSNFQILKDFKIGDKDNTYICDYMDCKTKCHIDKGSGRAEVSENIQKILRYNYSNNNENILQLNTTNIILKIKYLMKQRYFYTKKDLIDSINKDLPSPYPLSQILYSLTELIENNNDFILDKYNRKGKLINIGEYYLFQPDELSDKTISIFERSVPLDYKHPKISINIKNIETTDQPVINPKIDVIPLEDESKQAHMYLNHLLVTQNDALQILYQLFNNFTLILETQEVKRGDNNFYKYCGKVIRLLNDDENIRISIDISITFLIEHLYECEPIENKIKIMNILQLFKKKGNLDDELLELDVDIEKMNYFINKINIIVTSNILITRNIYGILFFDGSYDIENENKKLFILNDKNNTWMPAKPLDYRIFEKTIYEKYKKQFNFNDYVGFMGFELKKNISPTSFVFKIKDIRNSRSAGFRCLQSNKEKTIKILNSIYGFQKFKSYTSNQNVIELCIYQELILRYFQLINKDNKTWFVDTQTAIINNFESIKRKG